MLAGGMKTTTKSARMNGSFQDHFKIRCRCRQPPNPRDWLVAEEKTNSARSTSFELIIVLFIFPSKRG